MSFTLNTIYNEECSEGMKRIPDEFVDLTVTSPPYDNLRTYNGFTFDYKPVFRELYRVTKRGGGGCVDCGRRNGGRIGDGNVV